MKVEAKKLGFFDGEVVREGDEFKITSRLDSEAKKDAHAADIQLQFSSKWMTKL
jgi:hypothetical protein